MKAAGPAAEDVDRTDQLDTAVKTEDTAMAVDDVDVDDTAAADAYLQTNTHTASVFGMNHHHIVYAGDHTSEEQSKLHLGVTRSVLLGKKGLHFILQPSTLNDMLLQDAIR